MTSTSPDLDAAPSRSAAWRRALIHLAWALFAVLAIATAANLLALRRYEFNVKPLTPEVAAGQQQIADTFFALKLIPKAIRVSDAVVFAQQ